MHSHGIETELLLCETSRVNAVFAFRAYGAFPHMITEICLTDALKCQQVFHHVLSFSKLPVK